MRFVKTILIVLVVLVLLGGGLWQFWLKEQVAFGQMATAYGAKMVCSCRFVAERDMASCQTDFTVDVSPFTFEEGEQYVEVSVLGGLVGSRADYNPGLGCMVSE